MEPVAKAGNAKRRSQGAAGEPGVSAIACGHSSQPWRQLWLKDFAVNNPPHCLIRKFRNEDSAALVDLWKTVFPDDPPHNDPAKVINSKLAVDDLIFVAVIDTESEELMIGACLAGYDGHRGWLYAAAVAPGHQGFGVGNSLISHATDALKQLGCIKVNLQVRESNKPVVAFYESLGFEVEERISMGKLI